MQRNDGRAPDEIRPLNFELNVAPHAGGSVIVSMGNTRVICAVTIEHEQIGSAEIAPHTWTDIAASVPERYRGTIQRVYLEPARTWSPFDHGTREDMRTLGVSVRRIASR